MHKAKFEFVERTIELTADINAHIDQNCTGIEAALLFVTVELKQSALTTSPRKLS